MAARGSPTLAALLLCALAVISARAELRTFYMNKFSSNNVNNECLFANPMDTVEQVRFLESDGGCNIYPLTGGTYNLTVSEDGETIDRFQAYCNDSCSECLIDIQNVTIKECVGVLSFSIRVMPDDDSCHGIPIAGSVVPEADHLILQDFNLDSCDESSDAIMRFKNLGHPDNVCHFSSSLGSSFKIKEIGDNEINAVVGCQSSSCHDKSCVEIDEWDLGTCEQSLVVRVFYNTDVCRLDPSGGSNRLGAGATAGIVIGVILIAIILAALFTKLETGHGRTAYENLHPSEQRKSQWGEFL